MTVFKVEGETNTDDLSPALDAWSRPGHPAARAGHAQERPRRHHAGQSGRRGPMKQIDELKGEGPRGGLRRRRRRHRFVAQVGDQLGAVAHGERHPVRSQQARRRGLPRRQDRADLLQHDGRLGCAAHRVRRLRAGDGRRDHRSSRTRARSSTRPATTVSSFEYKSAVLLDEVRAGGRIPLIIGRSLTARAREALGLGASDVFRARAGAGSAARASPWRRRSVGKACGVAGCASRYLLRTAHDHGWLPGHHRAR